MQNLVAFHHEDAELGVFGGALERAIRREFGQVERSDFLDVEHFGKSFRNAGEK